MATEQEIRDQLVDIIPRTVEGVDTCTPIEPSSVGVEMRDGSLFVVTVDLS